MLTLLNRLPKNILLIISCVLVVIIGLADYLSGYFLSFSIFYLIPVMMATWYFGRTGGFLISILSGFAWFIADLMAEHVYPDSLIPFWNASLRIGFFLIVSHLLFLLQKSLENEQKFARQDHLTHVWNSRAFYEKAEFERVRSVRYGHPLSVAYIDLDNFKEVNDRHGHQSGDRLLYRVARTISENSRTTDILARLGGDEFVLLMVESGTKAAHNLMERIREKLLNDMEVNNWPVTFSIGMITYESPAESLQEMINEADSLMYEVKKKGKNALRQRINRSDKSIESTNKNGSVRMR
jgi:diguanylate cyclase (GGDEF)-like protein